MYDAMRPAFFWLHIANDVHTTMKACYSCVQHESQLKHKGKPHLSPAAWPFKFLAIDILGILGKQHGVNSMWLLWRTATWNWPVPFPPSTFYRRILRLYSSTSEYFCMVFWTIYWPIMAHSLSANSSWHYDFSKRLKSLPKQPFT